MPSSSPIVRVPSTFAPWYSVKLTNHTGTAPSPFSTWVQRRGVCLLISPDVKSVHRCWLAGEWGTLDLAAVEPRAWWGLAYLVTFGSLVGFVAYTWLLRNAPTPIVAPYAYINPVVAIVLGSLLAQKTITPRMLVSAAIIIGAVVLINLAKVFSGRAPEKREASQN